MRWKDVPGLDLPIFTAGHPRVAKLLELAPGGSARFWFVLEADEYDALLGNEVLQYFQGSVFDTEQDGVLYVSSRNAEADKRKRENDEPGVLHVLESLEVSRDGPVFVLAGPEPKPYQEYYVERILARIEETLASEGSLAWGTRFPGW